MRGILDPSPMPRDRFWLLVPFALGHAIAGGWLFVMAIDARFAEAWTLAAVLGPLLVAHAIGVTLRREPFDRKLGGAIAVTLRLCGVIGMMAGALALRTHLEGVWIAIAISGAVAGWGVAYSRVLQDCAGRFART